MSQKLKIAIIGAGAVGGYYGCLLARDGHDVHFLTRSDYDTVKEKGYEIRRKGETFHIKDAQVYGTTLDIGKVDLVIVALKSTANAILEELVSPLVDDHTIVLTLQNGMGNVERLAEFVPAHQILGGLCFVCINRVEPGVIENYLPGQIYIGEFLGTYRPRTVELVETFEAAGVSCYFSKSLDESLWRKLCWNVPFNGLAIAASGVSTKEILKQKPLVKLARALMQEVRHAALAHGHEIPDRFLDQQFKVTEGMGRYKPSSMIDFVQGRDVEVEAIFGEPLKRGEAKGVSMPHLRSLYWLLKGLCELRK